MNGSLSYLRDSWVRRDRKSSLYIDQASSEIFFFFFFPGYLMRYVAMLQFSFCSGCVCVCVEGNLDAGISHILVAKHRADSHFESPTDPDVGAL